MKWLRDWWRGWSDEDLASVLRKIPEQTTKSRSGEVVAVTQRELRAHVAYMQQRLMIDSVSYREPQRQ